MACMNYMRATGLSYPKACEECGLGPCRYPQHQEQPVAEIKHVYYTAAELEMIRQAGGPPPLDALPDALSQPPLKKWKPRVVQLVSHGNYLVALMDDGTMWQSTSGEWHSFAPPLC